MACSLQISWLIGDFRDNRFNGTFETAAELYHHLPEILATISKLEEQPQKSTKKQSKSPISGSRFEGSIRCRSDEGTGCGLCPHHITILGLCAVQSELSEHVHGNSATAGATGETD